MNLATTKKRIQLGCEEDVKGQWGIHDQIYLYYTHE